MISLSDHHKKEFEKKIMQISPKDEEKVRKHIQKELEKLQSINETKSMIKMDDLVKDATLLHDILHCESFPLSDSSKKWIVFGLGYLVSDFDLIPDAVPGIGYVDDALVLSWIVYMIDDVIKRYNSHLKALQYAENGGILKSMIQGDGDSEIILIPGLLNDSIDSDNIKKWVNIGKSLPISNGNPGISIIDWDMSCFSEILKTIKIIDHDLVLRTAYDTELFLTEWEQAIYDFELLGESLSIDIDKSKSDNPNKEIFVITFDVGNYAVDKAIEIMSAGLISRYHIFGGFKHRDKVDVTSLKKVNKVYNYYSDKDSVLKFILENFEYNNKPIGLAPIKEAMAFNIKNINVGKYISNHHEYSLKVAEIMELD